MELVSRGTPSLSIAVVGADEELEPERHVVYVVEVGKDATFLFVAMIAELGRCCGGGG